MPKILDGAAIAAAIKKEVAEEVRELAARGVQPGMAAVLVGHVAASEIYVRSKVQTCAELGLYSDLITPPDTVTTEEMLDLVTAAQWSRRRRRNPDPTPIAEASGCQGASRCGAPGEGCGWFSSGECGPAAGRAAGFRALYAGRGD